MHAIHSAKPAANIVFHRAAEDCDERLIERVAAADKAAMATLYTRHHVRIYRFLMRFVSNPAIAEDLVSEVFLDIWTQAQRFEGRARASTWMLSIARHKALSALRRRSVDHLDDETAATIPDSADGAETLLQRQCQASVMQECLTQLSPAHREIVDLVYYHGKSIAEVAEITDTPPNTVKTRMFHARKRLASLLHAHGLDAAA